MSYIWKSNRESEKLWWLLPLRIISINNISQILLRPSPSYLRYVIDILLYVSDILKLYCDIIYGKNSNIVKYYCNKTSFFLIEYIVKCNLFL